jgi:hypothetical protein
MRLMIVAIAALACSVGSLRADEICPNGAVYKIDTTGKTLVVKRRGIGQSRFTTDGPLQYGMALDLVTEDGQRGAIFGPMRSYMFVSDPDTLTKHGYTWKPALADLSCCQR